MMEENESKDECLNGEENTEIKDFSAELVDYPHVVEYIKNLENQIKSQNVTIQSLNDKILNNEKENEIEKKKYVNSKTQTNWLEIEEKSPKDWITDKKEAGTILDQVTEAAESAMLNTGFVYEQTTGLYYHYDTGYYYDPKSKLYYNGNTGTYYYYDEESKSYKFHSQAYEGSKEISKTSTYKKKDEKSKKRKKHKEKKRKPTKEKKKVTESEDDKSTSDEEKQSMSSEESSREEGLLSTTTSESEIEEEKDAKDYAPCMRIIVKETNIPKLKVGSLFIVTCTGGSIGREGDHCIIVPDINVSKHHAKLQYNEVQKFYEIIDLGSRNGTVLNGKRLSVAKKESEASKIVHGSILQLGQTKLLCHIHSGYDTCGHCEPGLLQLQSVAEPVNISIKSQHQEELKRLKHKFGLEGDNTNSASCVASGYQDRAQSRREQFGSLDEHSKTQQSSLNESISKDNMGFKMLVKMGWSEGECLGKSGDGITEPVPIQQTIAGMGENVLKYDEVNNSAGKKKQTIWKKTQKRFNKATNCNDAFI